MAEYKEDTRYPCKVYRKLDINEQLVMFADPAESQDYCAAVAFSKKHFDFPIVFNEVMESSQFGYELYNIGKYIEMRTNLWPKMAVERNTGQATIFVLQQLNYPSMFRMVDFTSMAPHEAGQLGWLTTGHITGGELRGTRRKMLDDLGLAIKQGQMKIYDKEQLGQLKSFVIVKGRAQARANRHDDLVMATAGAWQIAQLTPDEDFGDYDPEALKQHREKWRFK
jgi:hypothetical protein